MNTCLYTMSAAKLKSLASAYLKELEDWGYQTREALIRAEMQERKFLFGLIRVGPFSRQQAIKRLENEPCDMFLHNRWYDTYYRGSRYKDCAQRILTACECFEKLGGQNLIALSPEDLEFVKSQLAKA